MADSLDQELLTDLIRQLAEVNANLKMVGNSDRIVAAIGKLSVAMQQKKLTIQQEQDAIVKFGKGLDQATERIKENRQAMNQQRAAANQANAAINNLGTNATVTAQKLSKEAQIRQAGEDMRAARRKQWQEKEITSAGQLISEYQKGAGVTQILRDKLETFGGTSMALNVSARLATESLGAFGKSLLQYAKAVYAGEQGALVAAKSVTTFAEQVGTAATIIGTAMMFIPGLGIAARVAGGALSLLGIGAKPAAKAMELIAEQSDRVYDSFVTVSKAGVTGSDGMLGLAESAQRLGYGLDQIGIAAFNQLMTEASRDLAMMSGSAREGRKSFARFSGEIVKSETGHQLMMLGYSVDDINQGAAGFVKQQVALGLAQRKSQAELTAGAADYIKQLDAVTKLTGIQRKDLEAQMNANRRNERFRAAVEKTLLEKGDKAADNLQRNMAVVAIRFPDLAKGLQDISAGFVDTEEAQQAFRAGMSHIPELMTQDIGGGFQDLSQAARRATDSMGSLAPVGLFGKTFGNYTDMLEAAGMDQQDAAHQAREIVLDQIKGGDAAVKSQVDLRRSQMDTRDALQSLVRNGIEPATKALRKLSGLPEEIAETMLEPRAAGGEFNRGTAPEMQYAPGGTAPEMGAATGVPSKPMERNAVEEGARGIGSVLQGMGLGPKAGGGSPEQKIPPAPPAPPPRPGLEQSHETLKKMGLRIKEGDVQQEGKTVSPKILKMAQEIQASVPGFRYFSGFNDRFHNENAPRSFHTKGQALDFTLGYHPTKEEGRKILKMLNSMGADYARDEYNFPSSQSTAGHFHAHVREFARGGISRGPASGYAAMLHGSEAVVPLPDGRAIPVKISIPEIRNPFADTDFVRDTPDIGDTVAQMSQQIRQAINDVMRNYANNPAVESALQELVSLQRSNNSTQERLLQSSVN